MPRVRCVRTGWRRHRLDPSHSASRAACGPATFESECGGLRVAYARSGSSGGANLESHGPGYLPGPWGPIWLPWEFPEWRACRLRYTTRQCWKAAACGAHAKWQASSWTGGRRNAMQHCIYSCCMTRAVGRGFAKYMTDEHERVFGGPPCDMQRDYWNNREGRELGCDDDGQSCPISCMETLENGDRVIATNDPRIVGCGDCL